MVRSVRFCVAAAALMTASPALASDFSGIGRVIMWGVAAITVLIALLVTLFLRWRRPGERESEVLVSILAAVLLAPAGLMEVDGQWLPMPLPGAGWAVLEGSLTVLFPVPIIVMVLCGFGLLRLFAFLRARHDRKGGAP